MRLTRRLAAVLLAAAAGLTCTDGPMSPARGTPVSIVPSLSESAIATYQSLGAFGLEINNVRVKLKRASGEIVVDTTVAVATGQDAVELALTVVTESPDEAFTALLQLRHDATVLFQGESVVRAGVAQAEPIPTPYVGPGNTATRVELAPRDTTILAAAPLQLAATAYDATGKVVADLPLLWSVSDALLATVNETGTLAPTGKRGTVTVTAKSLIPGVLAQTTVALVPPPAMIAIKSGDGAEGVAGTTLAQPLQVKVGDKFGDVSANARVLWSIVHGGGSLAQSQTTTGADGLTSVSYTLGERAGTDTIEAKLDGTTASVRFVVRGVAGAPAAVTAKNGPSFTGVAGTTLGAPVPVVLVADQYGNPVAGATVTVVTTWPDGAATTSTRLTNAAGEAALEAIALPTTPGTVQVTATVGTLAPAAFTVNVVAAAASRITLATSADTVAASASIRAWVQLYDQYGNTVKQAGRSFAWSATNGGTFSAATTVTDSTGRTEVLFTSNAAGGVTHTITATATDAPSLTASRAVYATAAPPSVLIAIASGDGQHAAAGAPLAAPLVVRATNAQGAPLSGIAITWAAASGVLGAATSTTDTLGQAGTTYTAPTVGGTYTVTASLADGSSVAFTVTVDPAGFARFALIGRGRIAVPESTTTASPLAVRTEDQYGNPIGGATVFWSVGAGTGTLAAPDSTVSDAQGIASMPVNATTGSTIVSASSSRMADTLASPAVQADFVVVGVPNGIDRTWIGGTAGAEVDWANDDNWYPRGAPTASSRVYIPLSTSMTYTGGGRTPAYARRTTVKSKVAASSPRTRVQALRTTARRRAALPRPRTTSRTALMAAAGRCLTSQEAIIDDCAQLGQGAAVRSIRFEDGAVLDLLANRLEVAEGGVDGNAAYISSTGTIAITGGVQPVWGSLPGLEVAGGATAFVDYQTYDDLTVQGDATVAGTLEIRNYAYVTVNGGFSLTGGTGRLVNPASTDYEELTVLGATLLDGVGSADELGSANIYFGGNVDFRNASMRRLLGRGGPELTVTFMGGVGQTIASSGLATDTLWLPNVDVQTLGGPLALPATTHVLGALWVADSVVVGYPPGAALPVDGDVWAAGTSDLSAIARLELSGTQQAVQRLSLESPRAPAALLVSGMASVDSVGAALQAVDVTGTLEVNRPLTVGGNLTVEGPSAHLRMSGGATLTVGGDAKFDGAATDSSYLADLQYGTLDLKGTLAVYDTYAKTGPAFRPDYGDFTVVFSGDRAQAFNGTGEWSAVDPTRNSFLHLKVMKPGVEVLKFMRQVAVRGDLTVTGATPVDFFSANQQPLEVGGRITAGDGSALSIYQLHLVGQSQPWPSVLRWAAAPSGIVVGAKASVLLEKEAVTEAPLTVLGTLDLDWKLTAPFELQQRGVLNVRSMGALVVGDSAKMPVAPLRLFPGSQTTALQGQVVTNGGCVVEPGTPTAVYSGFSCGPQAVVRTAAPARRVPAAATPRGSSRRSP